MSAIRVTAGVPLVGVRTGAPGAHAQATIISIDEARARLRGQTDLEASISRHPASRGAASRRWEGTAHARARAQSAAQPAVKPLPALSLATIVKAVVALVLTMVLFASALGVGLMLRPAPFSGQTWVHSVAAGESVWGLAVSLELSRPLESVVEDIYALNALSDATLQPGQQLILPAE